MDNTQKVFSQIYDQCIDKIYRFIFLKVNSQEVAEDLTSETFLRGWRSFKNGSQEINNPNAFLYQIARNLVVDFYREKGKNPIISAENVLITDPKVNLEETALFNSDAATVRRAIAGLKEDYQNIIILHYLNDLSCSEISKIVDKPEGTIRVNLHRALKALKKEVREA